MKALALTSLLLILAATWTPTASATIDACTQPATTTSPLPVGVLLRFAGILAYMDGSCGIPGMSGSGVVGCGAAGCMAACKTPGIHFERSTYCGPIVPPGGSVICTWTALRGPMDLVTLGFDRNGDGNIYDSSAHDGPAFTLDEIPSRVDVTGVGDPFDIKVPIEGRGGTWQVTNPHPVPARATAFPTTTRASQTTAEGLIGCV